MEAVLTSIQVGKPKTYPGETTGTHTMTEREGSQPWTSGFAKEPVRGPVRVGKTNLSGDGQADLVNHGGPDKAILAYALHHYDLWRNEHPALPLGPGAFGENFTFSEIGEESVSIGDTFAVGTAVVQVSQPRIPCWKISRRWQTDGLTEQVRDTGRTGWYFRVLQEGEVHTGDELKLISRDYERLTVAGASDILNHRIVDPEGLREYADCPLLAEVWREMLYKRIATN